MKMFGADLMVRVDDRVLEQPPDALDAVRVDISAHPFLGLVVNALARRVAIMVANADGILVSHQALVSCAVFSRTK